ncbi:pyruvate carboxylase subunit B [Desulfofundulus sp. TPOSR]|uniref:pyruvate carboxylase subunit B n=1 Tax=Desulfofundulus sp. TPOSR TaxID=2714340 RepID=UPI00140CD7F3|nr:pyruvate carboxylase subunit B [Desulfofundulus sp. TPOSR]NHM28756.1 pyruvate carboxylase subunit B [Desulfofundulus sp. TPOSR]
MKLKFIDETLRDAHQSLWATRMTTKMMAPIARTMDETGYFMINLAGGAVFDTCVKYLGEDPWERLRLMRRLIPKTPLCFIVRGLTAIGWKLVPDDVVELTIRTAAKNGVRGLMVFDGLNDIRNMELSVRVGKDAGLYVIGWLVYAQSPVHTDEYYKQKAQQLIRLGVDAVMLEDASGVLTPERTRTLVPALQKAMGKVPLILHCHCLTGLAPVCYLEAIKLGVDMVATAISPLAQGESLPPTEFIARYAPKMGRAVELDDKLLKETAAYFTWVSKREGKPLGQILEYDPRQYQHQIPGGMISNLVSQLTEAGIQDRLPEVLDEVARIRQELGYPVMVTPLSQYVGVQATLNVIEGERYRTVPDEIRKYALGYYGELAAPIDPNVLDRIAGNAQPVSGRPAELLEPVLDKIRATQGPFASDEELLLYVYYSPQTLKNFYASRNDCSRYLSATTPLTVLLKELAGRREIKYFQLQKGKLQLTLS